MPIVTRHSLITVVVLALASLLIVGIFIWSGIYNIGADDTHTRPVYSMMQMLRERSISARASKLHPPPNLTDLALIRQGAGNYNSMCTGCHLAPGMEETELSNGLYPSPPNFSKVGVVDPAHHFWVIKHGIKASGMPAWGASMDDQYIWGMVAFLQQLPRLNAEQYEAMVASSGGHSHGGGETQMEDMPLDESKPHAHPPGTPAHQDTAADPHAGMAMGTKAVDESKPDAHPPGTPADHHETTVPATPTPEPTTTPGSIEHRHADGTVESHPAPRPTQADDGHDPEH